MSASALHLKVKHNRQVRQIALYNGLTAEELSSILQAVFALHANSVVVGLLSPQVRQGARVCCISLRGLLPGGVGHALCR
jgi:hypothetical protein